MKYVFGPIPSRLLGRSLGVDPIGLKTCNFNCVYCQLGRSRPMVAKRDEYAPQGEILDEIDFAIDLYGDDIDWVAIAGSGEPTLHVNLGDIIRGVKDRTDKPVAVFTNASLMIFGDVRRALQAADAVVPSVDAGDECDFRFVNRAHPSVTFADHLDGLARFRRDYRGQIWAQVMLVPGANDSVEALTRIRGALDRFSPDEVHVTRPSRPPAEYWVDFPERASLSRARTILRATNRRVTSEPGAHLSLCGEHLEDRLFAILARHPMTSTELAWWFGDADGDAVDEALATLRRERLIRRATRNGEVYWIPKSGGIKGPRREAL